MTSYSPSSPLEKPCVTLYCSESVLHATAMKDSYQGGKLRIKDLSLYLDKLVYECFAALIALAVMRVQGSNPCPARETWRFP